MNFDTALDKGAPLAQRYLIGIFIAAFLVRLINALFMSADPGLPLLEDGDHYWRGAQAWIDRGPMMHMTSPGQYVPQTERVPLYHIFLIPFRWMFGDSVLAPLIGQAVMDSLTCVVIASLGALLGASTGLVSGILAAVWPNFIVHSGMILGDTLFVFFIALILFFSARFLMRCDLRDLILVGFLCGLATMTRPVALFLPFAMAVVAPFVGYWHGRSRRFLWATPFLLLSVALLPSVPLAMRNYVQFDTFQLTAQGGSHMLHWVVGHIKADVEGRTFEDIAAELNEGLERHFQANGIASESLSPFEKSSHTFAFASAELSKFRLGVVLRVLARNAVLGVAAPAILTDPRIRKQQSGSYYNVEARGLWARVVQFVEGNNPNYLFWFFGALIIGFIGCLLQLFGFVMLARRATLASCFAALAICYFLLANGPVSLPKYRLPYEPVLIVCQAIAMLWIWRRLRRLMDMRNRAV